MQCPFPLLRLLLPHNTPLLVLPRFASIHLGLHLQTNPKFGFACKQTCLISFLVMRPSAKHFSLVNNYSSMPPGRSQKRALEEEEDVLHGCAVKLGELPSARRMLDEMPGHDGKKLVEDGGGEKGYLPSGKKVKVGFPHTRTNDVDIEILKKYSSMLQKCASKGSLRNGRALHGHIIKSCMEPDSHLWNCLIHLYAQCGDFNCAQRLLGEMPEHEDAVVSWHALISHLVEEGRGDEAVLLFGKMLKRGLQPNKFVYATCLKACSMCATLDIAEQVHGQVIKFGLSSYLYVGSALVDVYAKNGEVEVAEEVFSRMRQRDAITWNSLVNGYIRVGNAGEVLNLFHLVKEQEVRLNQFTLCSVIKACADLGDSREGKGLHALAVKSGLELNMFLSTRLIDMYSKCGLVEDAYHVFIILKNPDVVVWSSIISCFHQSGDLEKVNELFARMRATGVWPNEFILDRLISSSAETRDWRYGESIHAYTSKTGFNENTSVGNSLATMYMKNGHPQDGLRIFAALHERESISSNVFMNVLRLCAIITRMGHAKQVHAHVIRNCLDKDIYMGSALVGMYAKCGSLDSVCQVFDRLIEKDVLTWTVMITGYLHFGQGEKAIDYFYQMQQEGIKPNEFTNVSCLRACSSLGILRAGALMHSLVIKCGQLADGFVASSLIDMYGKCGCLTEFERVFKECSERDVVLWNTVICGYSHHRLGPKALEAFKSMLDEGVWPDSITFIGVLSACASVGLIEEGQHQFDSLNAVYGIIPTIEHHACMVDMLGRAGRFDELEQFILKMPLEPNILIWQSVLGACRMHGNVELGERAAANLFQLEPDMDSTYILLSNIYASKGQWENVAKVRMDMQKRGVKKESACSWIDVDGHVHVFIPQDRSHPQTGEIYGKLKELGQELSRCGYTPNTKDVLHNVDEDEKHENLLYHSERLALAFGLISLKPERSIRVFKNLRMCRDCHNVFKPISALTNRQIIVRDVSRFHHFQKGSCSCADYW